MEKLTNEKKVASAAKTDEKKVAVKDAAVAGKSDVQENEKAAVKDAEKEAEFKQRKAEAAKRFAEKQKQRKQELLAAAKEIVANPAYSQLSDATKKVIQDLLNPTTSSGSAGAAFLNKVFGDSPKVGDSVTLLDYMKRTLKGKAELDKRIKEWKEKGIVIKVEEKPNQFETLYTIEALA